MDIENAIDAQQAKANELDEDIARLMRLQAGSDPEGEFSPDTVISDANFRDVGSLTVGEIQEFLDAQPGTLASYSALDHEGHLKSTAQMIADAGTYWKISPKVILVTLQKEQSLLAKTSRPRSPTTGRWDAARPTAARTTSSRASATRSGGGQKLNRNAEPWYPGIEMDIDGSVVLPSNAATYSL